MFPLRRANVVRTVPARWCAAEFKKCGTEMMLKAMVYFDLVIHFKHLLLLLFPILFLYD